RDLELLEHGGLPVRRRGRGYALPRDPEPAPLGEAASLTGPVRDTLAEAVRTRRVVRLAYTDRAGTRSFRDVEAHGLVIAPYGEYLVGWCRMRDGPRMFRLDRVGAAFLSGRGAEVRGLEEVLEAAGHWAAGCDDALWEAELPDPRPFGRPGPPRPLADLLAGWRGPLAHVEWHLDRLTDEPPPAPSGDDEHVWVWTAAPCGGDRACDGVPIRRARRSGPGPVGAGPVSTGPVSLGQWAPGRSAVGGGAPGRRPPRGLSSRVNQTVLPSRSGRAPCSAASAATSSSPRPASAQSGAPAAAGSAGRAGSASRTSASRRRPSSRSASRTGPAPWTTALVTSSPTMRTTSSTSPGSVTRHPRRVRAVSRRACAAARGSVRSSQAACAPPPEPPSPVPAAAGAAAGGPSVAPVLPPSAVSSVSLAGGAADGSCRAVLAPVVFTCRLLSCAGPCVVVGPRGGGRVGAAAPPVPVAVGASSGSPRRLPFWDASPAGAVHGRRRSSPGGEVMRAAGTSARRGAGGGGTPGEPLQWTGRCGMCPPGST